MTRWFIVFLLAMLLISWVQPLLRKLGLGRLPGDLNFTLFGRQMHVPIASTLLLTFIASAIGHWL